MIGMKVTIRQLNGLGNALQGQGQHKQAAEIHAQVQKAVGLGITEVEVSDDLYRIITEANKLVNILAKR